MELKKLLNGLNNYKCKGNLDINIKRVESNSKKIVPDSLFVAIKGYDFNGHDYINEAIENGAIAILIDINADFSKIKIKKEVTVIAIENTRRALAIVSCNFFGNPSKYFKLMHIPNIAAIFSTLFVINLFNPFITSN